MTVPWILQAVIHVHVFLLLPDGFTMTHKVSRPSGLSRPRQQRGATLVESMVAILIFCIGIIGNLGLMAQMTRAQGGAEWKSQASMLSAELVATMWADKETEQANYNTGACGGHGRCSEWQQKVSRSLPQGKGTVEALGGGLVKVAIEWTIPGEGVHSYAIQTTVAR